MKRDWMLIVDILNTVAETGATFREDAEQTPERAYHLWLLTDGGYLDRDGLLTMKGFDFLFITQLPTFQRAHDMIVEQFGGASSDLLIDVTKKLYDKEIEHRRNNRMRVVLDSEADPKEVASGVERAMRSRGMS